MNISKAKLLLIAVTLTTTNIALAGTSKTYTASDNSMESKICVVAATGSTLKMNRAVNQILPSKFMGKKYTVIANNLSCNGVNVADFAAHAGNDDVAKKLKSYRTKTVTIRDIAATYSGNVSISS